MLHVDVGSALYQPLGIQSLVRWWLGCRITSSERYLGLLMDYLGPITILRRLIGSLGLSIWWSRFRLRRCMKIWVFHNIRSRPCSDTSCDARRIFPSQVTQGIHDDFQNILEWNRSIHIQNSEMWHMEVSIQSLLSTCVSETLDTTRENAQTSPKRCHFKRNGESLPTTIFQGTC